MLKVILHLRPGAVTHAAPRERSLHPHPPHRPNALSVHAIWCPVSLCSYAFLLWWAFSLLFQLPRFLLLCLCLLMRRFLLRFPPHSSVSETSDIVVDAFGDSSARARAVRVLPAEHSSSSSSSISSSSRGCGRRWCAAGGAASAAAAAAVARWPRRPRRARWTRRGPRRLSGRARPMLNCTHVHVRFRSHVHKSRALDARFNTRMKNVPIGHGRVSPAT